MSELVVERASFGFGQTRHQRRWPVLNQFAVPTVFVRLPMRLLAASPPQRLGKGLFGINCASLLGLGFRDRDHGLGEHEHGSALAWVDRVLMQAGLSNCTGIHAGPVWLHTFPAVLGYAFKPVSFWFCHDQANALKAVLAEVHNTFGERHAYLLYDPGGLSLHNGQTLMAEKVFHVSPFFPVRGHYHFRWLLKPTHSVVRIDYLDALHNAATPSAVSLSTSISGNYLPISFGSCLRVYLAYPAQAMTVVFRIHWQALKLWIKRVPFFRLPPPPPQAISKAHPLTKPPTDHS